MEVEPTGRDSSRVGRVRKTRAERAVWRLKDLALQWLWFALPVQQARIGYVEPHKYRFEQGPLTWLRERKHRKLRRRVHICLLDYNPEGDSVNKLNKLMLFWINERSKVCSASLNRRIGDADVVWVYCSDPIPPHKKDRLLEALKSAKRGSVIINPPEIYNSYHNERIFEALAEAGVSVPRSKFTEEDLGKTLVVYKPEGKHASAKSFTEYAGPKPGYRAFEFIDTRGTDGLYRKCRVSYILGAVWPAFMMMSENPNVGIKRMKYLDFAFRMTPVEVDQIRLVAKTLGLQFFDADYVRRADDDSPVFIDINVYPALDSKIREINRDLGYYGWFHMFDDRNRLGLPEPLGRSPWEVFDEVMFSFADSSARL